MRPRSEPIEHALAVELRRPHRGLSLFWLGQAGFLLRQDERVILIDPYLSDSLAEKYRGQRFDHRRMMPAPIAPDEVPRVDLVLCTHRHGDHMDPGTLRALAMRHSGCQFVVPAAELSHASALGPSADRLVAAEAGAALQPVDGVLIMPVAAAHETLRRDDAGRHHFLGYGIFVDAIRLYHSGDCVPYAGLANTVGSLDATLALLPVNGRDQTRADAGVPGNFTLEEAVALCRDTQIPDLIPHHWGMFAFNSIEARSIDALADVCEQPRILRPALDRYHRLG